MNTYSKKLALLGGAVVSTRLLIGAVHVLFLIQRGLSLQNLAWIQILCSITILLVGYPAGLLADLKGSKICVLIALICHIIYYFCCLFAPNMLAISLGSIFYSAGLAIFQITFQTWLVQTIRFEHPNHPEEIDHFTHLNAEYGAIGNMIITPLGTFFASSIHTGYEILYLISIFMMLFLIFSFNKIPTPSNIIKARFNFLSSTLNTLTFCKKNHLIKYFLIYSVLYAGVCQIAHHFWQPLFMTINEKQKFSTPIITGTLFFFVSVGQYLANRYVRHLLTNKTVFWEISIAATFLSSLCFLGVGKLGNLFQVGLAYVLIQVSLMIGEAVADHQIMKTLPSDHFASLYSLKGVMGRIGAIGSLYGIQHALNFYSVQEIYTFYSIPVIVTLFSLFLLKSASKKQR